MQAQITKTGKQDAPKASEYEEQCLLFEWTKIMQAQIPQLGMLLAIPNGAKLSWRRNAKGQRYSSEARRLLKSGLSPGAPDIALFCPNAKYHALFIELKVGKNKPTQAQIDWITALLYYGYDARVCYGWLAAKAAILEYLGVDEDGI